MQATANNNLVLKDFSSLEQFADPRAAVSYGGFYQRVAAGLIKGVHQEQVFREVGDRLVALAKQAHAFRKMDVLEEVSHELVSLPLPRSYETVGRYYQAVCIQRFGLGNMREAASLLEDVADNAPAPYRVQAIISLGANSRHQFDTRSALSLYCEASRLASRSGLYNSSAAIQTPRMMAVISSEEGNHRRAIVLLENLFPLAHYIRSSQPHVYYDYLNSLAVELGEVGRLEEAKNVSRIVLASPFAPAYPEWRETSNEIELKGWRPSRSVVSFCRTTSVSRNRRRTSRIDSSVPVIDEASAQSATILHLPPAQRSEKLTEPPTANEPAHVFSIREWNEKKMVKKENDTPGREKLFSQMDGRELLLEIMSLAGSKERTDDELQQMLEAINKVLSEPKGKGEK